MPASVSCFCCCCCYYCFGLFATSTTTILLQGQLSSLSRLIALAVVIPNFLILFGASDHTLKYLNSYFLSLVQFGAAILIRDKSEEEDIVVWKLFSFRGSRKKCWRRSIARQQKQWASMIVRKSFEFRVLSRSGWPIVRYDSGFSNEKIPLGICIFAVVYWWDCRKAPSVLNYFCLEMFSLWFITLLSEMTSSDPWNH